MNTSPPKRVVIVDGYSTARDLLPELLDRNVLCIHLQSTAQVPADALPSFDPRPYDADLGYIGEAPTAIATLAELEPDEVIAGSEWGVAFAEEVAHGMGLPTNRIGTIGARRNKFEMIEALRRNGLRAAEQVKVTRIEAAHAWASSHGRWPVVVKPLTSAAAEGVAICRSHADIDQAFAAAFGRTNSMGGHNNELLLQSYLTGPQFIVNAVSRGGRHYVTDAWRQTTAVYGEKVVPRETSLLDPTEFDRPGPHRLHARRAAGAGDRERRQSQRAEVDAGGTHSDRDRSPADGRRDGPRLLPPRRSDQPGDGLRAGAVRQPRPNATRCSRGVTTRRGGT